MRISVRSTAIIRSQNVQGLEEIRCLWLQVLWIAVLKSSNEWVRIENLYRDDLNFEFISEFLFKVVVLSLKSNF